jgi:hypothetical protein
MHDESPPIVRLTPFAKLSCADAFHAPGDDVGHIDQPLTGCNISTE